MRPRTRANRRRGFTLVELVTAASLMTVIMLGVVQVFGIIMQTTSDAEGIHFAQQQLRALLNRLHNDLRGMTREGYLKIRRVPAAQTKDYLDTGPYSRDTLAFVTIGQCTSAFDPQPYEGTAAEVVYTNNVLTPNQALKVETRDVDARRGILARGQWMMTGKPGGNAGPWDDDSRLKYCCDLFADQQRTVGGMGAGQDRVSSAGQQVRVEPWIATEGPPPHPGTLKRVMACCVSEFHVEIFEPDASGAPGSTGYFESTISPRNYTWSWRPDPAGTIKTWPRALRVTVAVHDPSDAEPPQRDSGGKVKRFRGFALQEVFWLTDP